MGRGVGGDGPTRSSGAMSGKRAASPSVVSPQNSFPGSPVTLLAVFSQGLLSGTSLARLHLCQEGAQSFILLFIYQAEGRVLPSAS